MSVITPLQTNQRLDEIVEVLIQGQGSDQFRDALRGVYSGSLDSTHFLETRELIVDPAERAAYTGYFAAKHHPEDSLAQIAAEDALTNAISANNDPLTGALTRSTFRITLQNAYDHANRHREPFSILYLDANGFKRINDALGHAAGDEVLQFYASTLMGHVRKTDQVYRLGGDEFAIILPNTSAKGAIQKAKELYSHTNSSRKGIPVSLSIGIITYEPGSNNIAVEELVSRSDAAMYKAKYSRREDRPLPISHFDSKYDALLTQK